MYNFFLGDNMFPVAPPSMNVTINNKNETVTLMDEGEVNLIKKPGLTDIEFELLLPNKQYPFAVYESGFQPASYYLDILEKAKVDDKPVQFIVNRIMPDGSMLFDTNMTVTLEDYTITEDAEELGFDVKVTIRLKQYKYFGTKRLKIETKTNRNGQTTTAAVTEKKRSTVGKTIPKTYTVKSGDTLFKIAKLQLNDGQAYKRLAELNNIKNPDIIQVGQVIRLE